MGGTRVLRGKGQPEREIFNLLATLDEEQRREKHDIAGLYEGRLRSHAQNFEGLKRKWEGFTGVPVPKRLRTSEPDESAENCDRSGVSNASAAAPRDEPPAKAMPSHPDDKLDVGAMLVNDLRRELKRRQLLTTGKKVALQARLRKHLAEAKGQREAEWAAKLAKEEEEEGRARNPIKTGDGAKKGVTYNANVEEMDAVMEDAEEDGAEAGSANDSGEVRPPEEKGGTSQDRSTANEALRPTATAAAAPAKVSVVNNPPAATSKPAPKSALKPSKYASSEAQGTPAKPAANAVRAKSTREDSPAPKPKQFVPVKVSESSSESSNYAVPKLGKGAKTQSSAQKAKATSTAAKTAPSGSVHKTKGADAGVSRSLLERKQAHAEATEARKARLAEMRQKSKQAVASATSSAKPPSSHSKYAVSSTLKKMASGSTLGESKSSSIVAEMREKAAAKNSAAASSSKTAGSAKKFGNASGPKRGSQAVTSQPGLKPTALKSILDPSNKPSPVREVTKPEAKKPEEKPLSPMQTYEMSEREDSDSESDSDDEYERQKPKKPIPAWAQRTNLHRALEAQFADGPSRLDPDKIFGEVITCNLEEIFDKKKSRYHKRTSSGNWSKDHVTLAEKRTYKRTMGYA
ncbi:hypothetical protein ACHAWF_015397 [Thalassiosira exigua]